MNVQKHVDAVINRYYSEICESDVVELLSDDKLYLVLSVNYENKILSLLYEGDQEKEVKFDEVLIHWKHKMVF